MLCTLSRCLVLRGTVCTCACYYTSVRSAPAVLTCHICPSALQEPPSSYATQEDPKKKRLSGQAAAQISPMEGSGVDILLISTGGPGAGGVDIRLRRRRAGLVRGGPAAQRTRSAASDPTNIFLKRTNLKKCAGKQSAELAVRISINISNID